MTKLYLVGSLRNPRIPQLAKRLRKEMPEIEVFDDWYAAGPEADDFWKEYEQDRSRSYQEALEGHAAKHVFAFDKHHIDTSTHVLLVLPAGKSGHIEITYAAYGAKKQTGILLDPDDVRWDVMYQFIPTILTADDQVADWVARTTKREIKELFYSKPIRVEHVDIVKRYLDGKPMSTREADIIFNYAHGLDQYDKKWF